MMCTCNADENVIESRILHSSHMQSRKYMLIRPSSSVRYSLYAFLILKTWNRGSVVQEEFSVKMLPILSLRASRTPMNIFLHPEHSNVLRVQVKVQSSACNSEKNVAVIGLSVTEICSASVIHGVFRCRSSMCIINLSHQSYINTRTIVMQSQN